MQKERDYLLRLKGIEEGRHQLNFNLGESFFKELNHETLMNAQLDCNVSYEKKGDLIIMEFTFKGWVNVECDRCTSDIALTIDESYRMWASYQNRDDADEKKDILDQEDWLFLTENQDSIDLKSYLIDFSILSAPTHFRYDCRKEKPFPCDEEVLNKIGYFEDEEEQESTSSIWENLKSIKWD